MKNFTDFAAISNRKGTPRTDLEKEVGGVTHLLSRHVGWSRRMEGIACKYGSKKELIDQIESGCGFGELREN